MCIFHYISLQMMVKYINISSTSIALAARLHLTGTQVKVDYEKTVLYPAPVHVSKDGRLTGMSRMTLCLQDLVHRLSSRSSLTKLTAMMGKPSPV